MKSINRIVLWAACLFCSNMLMAQTPVAYYSFSGNANDATGTLNGTVHGAALTTDRFGNANSAYSFDGTGDNINLSNSNVIRPFAAIAVSAWVFLQHPNTSGLGNSVISCSDDAGYNITFINPSQIEFSVRRNNADASVLVDATPYYNAWHFIAGTYDGQFAKIYIDGVLKGTNDAGAVFPIQYSATANTYIGVEPGPAFTIDPNFNFNGAIDELKIYDVALTALQIQQDFVSSSQIQKPGSGNAISFNGTTQSASIPNTPAINFGTADFSLGFWYNSANNGKAEIVFEKRDDNCGDGQNWSIRKAADQIYLEVNVPGPTSDVVTISNAADGNWHHIVFTRTATQLTGFKDGLLVATTNATAQNVNNSAPIQIATGPCSPFFPGGNGFFNGSLDEIQFWNAALTQTQIRDRMCHKITSGDALYSNLVAYYNFDESTGAAAAVFDGTVNANNGTLANGPTRITSGAAIGDASTHDYLNTIKTVSLVHASGENFTVTSTSGNPDGIQVYRIDEQPNTLNGINNLGANDKYFGVFQVNGIASSYQAEYNYTGNTLVTLGNENALALYKRNDNAGTIWTNSSATLNTTAKTLVVPGQHTEYMLGIAASNQVLKPGSGNAISFDGFDDGVEVTNSAALQFPGDLSVECWVKIPETQNNNANIDNAIIEKWGGNNSGIGYPFVIRYKKNDKTAQWIRYNGSDSKGIDGITVVGDNKWHHLAATKSGSLLRFYVDGIIQGTTTDFADLTNVNNTQNLNIGTRGPIAIGPNNLTGLIDEVRIWHIGLTQAQIRDRMCKKITNADPLYNNLAAYYNFDETDGNTVFDATVNGNNGTLANNPTRLTSGAAIGNASNHDYTNTIKSASITQANGESIAITSTTGNPDGIQLYSVNEQPNTLNGVNTIGSSDAYFGVFQVNGTNPQYTAVYNYLGNPAVTALNEANLQLYNRADNAATSWTPLAAVPNTSAKTITVSGEHTEYLLGKTDIALPLTLLAFTAAKQNNSVQLNWTTRNEINTASFLVERSNGNNNFSAIGQVKASGQIAGAVYQLTDAAPFATGTTQYYRLKMVDKDGRWVYSNIIKINSNTQTIVSIYPNPATSVISINSQKNQQGIIVNAAGQTMSTITLINGSQTLNISQWPTGLYMLKTQDEVIKIIKNQ